MHTATMMMMGLLFASDDGDYAFDAYDDDDVDAAEQTPTQMPTA